MPNIAVVVTCADQGRSLPDCIECLQAQSPAPDEILIVDAGSSDVCTRQVLARLEASNLRVIRSPRRGTAHAKNLGMSLCSAAHVLILEGDDILDGAFFREITTALAAAPDADFLACGVSQTVSHESSAQGTPEALTYLLTHIPVEGVLLVRRDLWNTLGGFDQEAAPYEDHEFWVAAVARAAKGRLVNGATVRQHSARRRAERRTHLRSVEAILRKHERALGARSLVLLDAKDEAIANDSSRLQLLEQEQRERRAGLDAVRAEFMTVGGELRQHADSSVDFGDLNRLQPLSAFWGIERGLPLDRHYIHQFLQAHRADIRGRVLEVKDPGYTRAYGTEVSESAVLDVDPGNPLATIVADLTAADHLPSGHFDCFILTQTLHIIYEVRRALFHAARLLKPGGVLLCTVPAVSRINYEDGGLDRGDYWRFTEASLRSLFSECFPPESFEITPYGNVQVCAAFLYGLSPHELPPHVLSHVDPWFPLGYCVRAVRPPNAVRIDDASVPHHVSRSRSEWGAAGGTGAILMYHRVGLTTPDASGLSVTPADFRAQMQYVKEHCVPMPLHDLVAAATNDALPNRAVAVTFDDGYPEMLGEVGPALDRLQVPATYFVTTGLLDRAEEFWWDVVDRVFLETDPLPLSLNIEIGGRLVSVDTATLDERRRAHHAVKEEIYRLTFEEREAALTQLRKWTGLPLSPRSDRVPLDRQGLARLGSIRGITLGAHTVHHLWLPAQSRAVQVREVLDNKHALEAIIDREVSAFSYPFGANDETTLAVVGASGFRVAVTSTAGIVQPGVNALLLPRVQATTATGFKLQMESLLD